jgi:hypothetical protein
LGGAFNAVHVPVDNNPVYRLPGFLVATCRMAPSCMLSVIFMAKPLRLRRGVLVWGARDARAEQTDVGGRIMMRHRCTFSDVGTRRCGPAALCAPFLADEPMDSRK